MEKRELKIGDVVQINPQTQECFFRGMYMTVTDPKEWGAQGFISEAWSREELPKRAYFRATWEQMEYVGHAAWIPEGDIKGSE